MFQSTVTCMFLEVGGHTLLLFPETESFKSKFRDIKEKKKKKTVRSSNPSPANPETFPRFVSGLSIALLSESGSGT